MFCRVETFYLRKFYVIPETERKNSHHAEGDDKGRGMEEHGGRDHEGGGDEIRKESME